MLFLSKSSGPAVFATIAALVLAVGFLIAFRPSLRAGAVAVVCVVAALGLVAGGVSAALEGERELHPHETTGALADEGQCDNPEETEADENASQDVAAIANLTAEVILREDATLVAENLGVTGDQNTVIVTRGNPTNILFRNETEEDRRLVLDLGTRAEVDPQTGDTIPDTEVPAQECTQLVKEGGDQLLTFSIPTSSAYAESPYRLFVPGVEGAEVAVLVP
jgi:hypothetical protein